MYTCSIIRCVLLTFGSTSKAMVSTTVVMHPSRRGVHNVAEKLGRKRACALQQQHCSVLHHSKKNEYACTNNENTKRMPQFKGAWLYSLLCSSSLFIFKRNEKSFAQHSQPQWACSLVALSRPNNRGDKQLQICTISKLKP